MSNDKVEMSREGYEKFMETLERAKDMQSEFIMIMPNDEMGRALHGKNMYVISDKSAQQPVIVKESEWLEQNAEKPVTKDAPKPGKSETLMQKMQSQAFRDRIMGK